MPALSLTRNDWDLNPAYPWAGHLAPSNAYNLQILPAGVQEWIIFANLPSTPAYLAWRRVYGDWRTGASPPHSHLSMGPTHWYPTASLPAALIGAANIFAYNPYPATLAGTTTGNLVMWSTGAGTTGYATIDYDASTVGTVTVWNPNLTPYTNPSGLPSVSLIVRPGNDHNIMVMAPNSSFSAVFTGAIDPTSGLVSTPVQIPDPGYTGTPWSWLVDKDTYYIRPHNGTTSYLFDLIGWTGPAFAYTQTTPFPTTPASGPTWDNVTVASDGPSAGTMWSTGGGLPPITGYLRFGNQLIEGATKLTVPGSAESTPRAQFKPTGGWNGAVSTPPGGYTPLLFTDAFPVRTQVTIYTIGHTSDGSPTLANTATYPAYPFYQPAVTAGTQPWFFGGLTFQRGASAGQALRVFNGQYDIYGGVAHTTADYAPALWAFGDNSNPNNPVNLWAGATI